MHTRPPRVGLVALTDSRETARQESSERHIFKQHTTLSQFILNHGFDVADSAHELRKKWTGAFGLYRMVEIDACAEYFDAQAIDCLIIECWHWVDPAAVVALVQRTDVPTVLFCDSDMAWDGSGAVIAAGAALSESGAVPHAATHRRIRGNKDELITWLRGVTACAALRRSSIVLWGSGAGMHGDWVQDDVATLKARLIGDVLQEGQIVLTSAADAILAKKPNDVEHMIAWMKKQGVKIKYDKKMLTPETLAQQVALYLAARRRLDQLEKEEGVCGCSIKCHTELSEGWGVTGCLLPTFLPFPRDASGPKPEICTVCKGDVRGLITSLLLRRLAGNVPPLFGTVRSIGDSHVLIGNCGGASAWYAANSTNLSKVLPKLALSGQCIGRGGGAFEFSGRPGDMTFARLARPGGKYQMQMGVGASQSVRKEVRTRLRAGANWPLHVVRFPVDSQLLFEVLAGDHVVAVPGDVTAELACACREAGVTVVRIDTNEGLRAAREAM